MLLRLLPKQFLFMFLLCLVHKVALIVTFTLEHLIVLGIHALVLLMWPIIIIIAVAHVNKVYRFMVLKLRES